MTKEDITEARKFSDGIARSRYFIDIHNPTGAQDVQQIPGKRGAVKSEFSPPPGDFYEIPFRCLINEEFPNLVVACRALSATHEANSAIRVMAVMHGIGESAGLAAAEACDTGMDVNSISGELIRNKIPYMSEKPDFGYPWNTIY